MVEIIWHEMPKEVKAVVEPLLEQYEYLFPSWIRALSVRYGEGSVKGSVAEILAEVPYLQAKLYITRQFLDDNDRNRERTIVHELLHLSLAPLQDWVDNLMEMYVNEEDIEAVRKQFYEQPVEQAVQNLMYAVVPVE